MRDLVTAEGLACPSGAAGDTAALEKLCEILDALNDLDVTIDGNVSVDVESAPTPVEYCVGWCDPITACYVKEAAGGMALVGWLQDGAFFAGSVLPAGAVQGACPMPVKDELAVYTVDDEGCTVFVRLVTVLCFGPVRVVMVDGVKTPDVDTLGDGEFFGPVDLEVGPCARCVPCPVDPKDAYEPGEVASLIVMAPCPDDCGVEAEPTTVTWGDVVIPVTPDLPWCLPTVDCETNAKPIVISGPSVQTKLWTYEVLEEGC